MPHEIAATLCIIPILFTVAIAVRMLMLRTRFSTASIATIGVAGETEQCVETAAAGSADDFWGLVTSSDWADSPATAGGTEIMWPGKEDDIALYYLDSPSSSSPSARGTNPGPQHFTLPSPSERLGRNWRVEGKGKGKGKGKGRGQRPIGRTYPDFGRKYAVCLTSGTHESEGNVTAFEGDGSEGSHAIEESGHTVPEGRFDPQNLPFTRHLGLNGPVGSTATPVAMLEEIPPAPSRNKLVKTKEASSSLTHVGGSGAAGRVGFGVNGPYGPQGAQPSVDYRGQARVQRGKGKGLYGQGFEMLSSLVSEDVEGASLKELGALLGGDGEKVISNLAGLLGSGRTARKTGSTGVLDFDEVFKDEMAARDEDFVATNTSGPWHDETGLPPAPLLVGQAPLARMTGVCSRWMEDRGYGFLETDDGELREVYCHASALAKGDPKALQDGEKVEFDVVEDSGGNLIAQRVVSLGGAFVTSMWDLPEWTGSSSVPHRPNVANDRALYGYDPWEGTPGRQTPEARMLEGRREEIRQLASGTAQFGTGRHTPLYAPRLPPAPYRKALPAATGGPTDSQRWEDGYDGAAWAPPWSGRGTHQRSDSHQEDGNRLWQDERTATHQERQTRGDRSGDPAPSHFDSTTS